MVGVKLDRRTAGEHLAGIIVEDLVSPVCTNSLPDLSVLVFVRRRACVQERARNAIPNVGWAPWLANVLCLLKRRLQAISPHGTRQRHVGLPRIADATQVDDDRIETLALRLALHETNGTRMACTLGLADLALPPGATLQ